MRLTGRANRAGGFLVGGSPERSANSSMLNLPEDLIGGEEERAAAGRIGGDDGRAVEAPGA